MKAIQDNKGARVSILVTGGFHSPGLTAQLTQAGATVIRVVPKIEKLETTQGATSLSVFAQEKTPLDVLFSGEKLFLAHNPISPKVRSVDLPATVAAADGGNTGPIKAVFGSLIPTSVAERIRAMTEKIKKGFSELTIHFNEGWTYRVKANNVSGGALEIKREIRKQSLNPLKLLEEQFFVLRAAVVTMVIASAALIFNIPLLFPVAFVAGLFFLKKAEEPFLKFHPKVNAEILETSPENYYNFVRLGFWIFGGLTLLSLLYGLMGLPAFDVQRVAEIFFKHVFGYGLGYHALFNFISPIPAMAQISGKIPHVFKNTTAVVNLMDLGSYLEGNSVDYGDSIAKLEKLLPEYQKMGIKELYLTNGLFELSDMGKKVHTSPPETFRIFQSGNAYSIIGDKPYITKGTNILGTQLDDRHGSNFSVRDMRVLNPKIFRSETNEGRWVEFAAFVETARKHGIKIKVDLVPWISPDGITKENWEWANHHEIVMRRKKSLPPLTEDEIRKILQDNSGNSLIRWVEGDEEVWATVSNFGVGVDQVYPNWRHAGYQSYIQDSLKKMIDAGVESVRVDMAHELGDTQFEFWDKIINGAKDVAKGHGRDFNFLMEAYGDDWINKFLARFPEEKTYYVDPFHNVEKIAKGNPDGLTHLLASLEYALTKKGQLVVFPTNFDEWSLRDLKGPTHSFLALLLVYEWMGVPLMIDTRELMDEDGQNIPQAGGQDETEEKSKRFKHPFRSAVREGWEAFLNIFRHSPHRPFFEDMRDLLKAAEEIEFLDNTNKARFVALSVKKKSGDYEIRVLDFYPSWGEVSDFWVEVPKYFLAANPRFDKESENHWKWRLREKFATRDRASSRAVSLKMRTVKHNQDRWYRFPITFGEDKVGRLIIQRASRSVRLHDVSSILPILWKPLSAMFLVITGFVALGFSGAALPMGLSMGMLVLAWDQNWVGLLSKSFKKKPGIESSTPRPNSQAEYINTQLNEEPARLGVNELQQNVWNAAVREARSQDPTAELWDAKGAQGTPVVFVSHFSVGTEEQRAGLSELIRRLNPFIITDANMEFLSFDPDRVFRVGPEEFAIINYAEGRPLGLTRVSLAALKTKLKLINKNGGNRGLRFHQSLGLQLSIDGLDEKDDYITEAAAESQMLNDLFQWGVPVRLLNFPAIINALRVLARHA
ncbi:MAG: hypothetical protein KBG07_02180 [Elusimicrobia bacterium]|nr:hypothetical protein [Elusimicrobiota bacterium]